MAHDVFISYSSKDKPVADAACASLEGRGIRCWIAPRDVMPGAAYAEALIDGLNQSRLMVLVFSSNSNNSPQVIREVERAVNKGIPILPFRIEDVIPSKSMEYFVSSSHWLDAMTPPLERHLQKLADTVQLLLNNTGQQQTELASPIPRSPAKSKKLMPVLVIIGVIIVAGIIGGIFLGGGFSRRGLGPATPPGASSAIPKTPVGPPGAAVKNLPAGVLYADDFNNPASGWPRLSNDVQFCNYENGEFRLQGKKLGTNILAVNQNAGRFSDMVIEAEGRLVSGSDTSLYGTVFRMQDGNNYYCFMISGDGSCVIEKRVEGVFTPLAKKTISTFIKKTGTVNRMKINCKGPDIELYVNGSRLANISDNTFSDGWVGLVVHPNEASATAHFDNIRITKSE